MRFYTRVIRGVQQLGYIPFNIYVAIKNGGIHKDSYTVFLVETLPDDGFVIGEWEIDD